VEVSTYRGVPNSSRSPSPSKTIKSPDITSRQNKDLYNYKAEITGKYVTNYE